MTLRHWLVALAVAFLLGWAGAWHFTRRAADAKLEANTGRIRVADTVLVMQQAKTDTIVRTVTERIRVYELDTLWRRDTVTHRDTLKVLVPWSTVQATDSTIRACRVLAGQVGEERSACQAAIAARDERIKLLEHKPWHSRLGCTAGYGAVLSAGDVRHGAGLTCGVQFP